MTSRRGRAELPLHDDDRAPAVGRVRAARGGWLYRPRALACACGALLTLTQLFSAAPLSRAPEYDDDTDVPAHAIPPAGASVREREYAGPIDLIGVAASETDALEKDAFGEASTFGGTRAEDRIHVAIATDERYPIGILGARTKRMATALAILCSHALYAPCVRQPPPRTGATRAHVRRRDQLVGHPLLAPERPPLPPHPRSGCPQACEERARRERRDAEIYAEICAEMRVPCPLR